MKLIVAGSRGMNNYNLIKSYLDAIHAKYGIELIIQGDCPNSPDVLAKRWAEENNIEHEDVPADWDFYGRSAGYKRNVVMATCYGATNLIAFQIGSSNGTQHMIDISKDAGIKVKVVHL